VSTGALADLRTKVKDLAVFWIGTHGGMSDIQLGPEPNARKISVFVIASGEHVVHPCEASADCQINRADMHNLALLHGRFVDGGPDMWVLTREFVSEYWSFQRQGPSPSQSIAYLDGCSTESPESPAVELRLALKNAGVGHVLGWDGLTTIGGSASVAS